MRFLELPDDLQNIFLLFSSPMFCFAVVSIVTCRDGISDEEILTRGSDLRLVKRAVSFL